MSVTAAFRFVQGSPYGDNLAAVGLAGVAVTCEWVGEGTPQSWTWELISVPGGSSLIRGPFAVMFSPNAYFTPDIAGGYLIRLTVLDPQTGEQVSRELAFLVAETSGRIIPPFRSSPPSLKLAPTGPDEGWHPFMEEWLRYLETVSGGGGGSAGVDNILGNQIKPGVYHPLYTPGDKLQIVVGAKPNACIQVTLGQLILRTEARNVTFFNENSNQVEGMIVLPGRERPCGMCTDGTFIYIAGETGTLYKYDFTFTLVASFLNASPVVMSPGRVEMVIVSGYVFSILDASGYDDNVYRLKVSDGVATTLSVFHPLGIQVDSLNRVWVGSEAITGDVTIITPATFATQVLTVPGFTDVRPVLSVASKMLVSADGTGEFYRYNELTTPTLDATCTGFPTDPPKGMAYDSGGNVALVYYGLGTVGTYVFSSPDMATTPGANINPAATTDIQTAVYSNVAAKFIALDGYIDRAWGIAAIPPGISTYLEIGGMVGFAP